MTPRICKGWQHVMGRWRDDIGHALERWWPGHPPETAARHTASVASDVSCYSSSLLSSGGGSLYVQETETEFIVLADLPGLKRDDYTVEVTGTLLMIRGEQKRATGQGDCECSLPECHDGAFVRILRFFRAIAPEQAHATYANGVLGITLPKTTRATSTWVQVDIQEGERP